MYRRTLLGFAAATPLLRAGALHAQPGAPVASSTPAAPAAPQPGPNDAADIARVEAYLNGIHTLKARFLQVAPDGALSEGTAWMERPGRMRFEYNPPARMVLVASAGTLAFEDDAIGQTSEIPLSSTPLGILLANHVRLSGDVTVTALHRLPGQLQVTLIRTGSPGDGSLTLVFGENPLVLKQWTVLDAQRRETRVTLYNVELGGRLDPKLFQWTPTATFH